jgi:hypothetical protein
MEEVNSPQSDIHIAIEAQAPFPDAALTGWIVIAEWLTPDGEKKLARLNSEDASHWQVSGYLHDALFNEEVALEGSG